MNTYHFTIITGLFKREYISVQEVNKVAALERVKQMIDNKKARYKMELV